MRKIQPTWACLGRFSALACCSPCAWAAPRAPLGLARPAAPPGLPGLGIGSRPLLDRAHPWRPAFFFFLFFPFFNFCTRTKANQKTSIAMQNIHNANSSSLDLTAMFHITSYINTQPRGNLILSTMLPKYKDRLAWVTCSICSPKKQQDSKSADEHASLLVAQKISVALL
jgi:hypothetical protein